MGTMDDTKSICSAMMLDRKIPQESAEWRNSSATNTTWDPTDSLIERYTIHSKGDSGDYKKSVNNSAGAYMKLFSDDDSSSNELYLCNANGTYLKKV